MYKYIKYLELTLKQAITNYLLIFAAELADFWPHVRRYFPDVNFWV